MLLQFLLWLVHMPLMLNSGLSIIKYTLMVTRVCCVVLLTLTSSKNETNENKITYCSVKPKTVAAHLIQIEL